MQGVDCKLTDNRKAALLPHDTTKPIFFVSLAKIPNDLQEVSRK
jgi:hypothetical protein